NTCTVEFFHFLSYINRTPSTTHVVEIGVKLRQVDISYGTTRAFDNGRFCKRFLQQYIATNDWYNLDGAIYFLNSKTYFSSFLTTNQRNHIINIKSLNIYRLSFPLSYLEYFIS